MAKDGTKRGGRRIGAGKKKEIPPTPEFEIIKDLELPSDLPPPSDYLKAIEQDGNPLGADQIYKEVYLFLREKKCDKLVNPRTVESYAQAFARYIQCEKALSQYGLLSKHPTTNQPIASPFVLMSQNYQKQIQSLWYEIGLLIKDVGLNEQDSDDDMEQLLGGD